MEAAIIKIQAKLANDGRASFKTQEKGLSGQIITRMGVNDLWQVLEPVKQHIHLNSLAGKTIAVDLSLWVCEAQTVKKMIGTVMKPHLRNLFFSYLMFNTNGCETGVCHGRGTPKAES